MPLGHRFAGAPRFFAPLAAFFVRATSGDPMAFKPNYNQQRSERNRVKEAKKQEKLQRREEEVAKRKAARDEHTDAAPMPEDGDAAPAND
jgi:hypothetical protein